MQEKCSQWISKHVPTTDRLARFLLEPLSFPDLPTSENLRCLPQSCSPYLSDTEYLGSSDTWACLHSLVCKIKVDIPRGWRLNNCLDEYTGLPVWFRLTSWNCCRGGHESQRQSSLQGGHPAIIFCDFSQSAQRQIPLLTELSIPVWPASWIAPENSSFCVCISCSTGIISWWHDFPWVA